MYIIHFSKYDRISKIEQLVAYIKANNMKFVLLKFDPISFRLDHGEAKIDNTNGKTCFNETKANHQPGDFSSDAQFFVFTGVIAWLGSTACLAIYVFFSQRYLDDSKTAPMFVSY